MTWGFGGKSLGLADVRYAANGKEYQYSFIFQVVIVEIKD